MSEKRKEQFEEYRTAVKAGIYFGMVVGAVVLPLSFICQLAHNSLSPKA